MEEWGIPTCYKEHMGAFLGVEFGGVQALHLHVGGLEGFFWGGCLGRIWGSHMHGGSFQISLGLGFGAEWGFPHAWQCIWGFHLDGGLCGDLWFFSCMEGNLGFPYKWGFACRDVGFLLVWKDLIFL